MEDLIKYDEGRMASEMVRNIFTLPLLSWDLHIENLYTISHLKKDLAEIKKLTEKSIIDIDLATELKDNNSVIVITDTNLKIEFASANMFGMSGYLPAEVVGKSPKMFQGSKTDKVLAKKIRTSVDNREPFEAILVNYKKNHSAYKCYIKGYPIFDKKGNLLKYAAVEHVA